MNWELFFTGWAALILGIFAGIALKSWWDNEWGKP